MGCITRHSALVASKNSQGIYTCVFSDKYFREEVSFLNEVEKKELNAYKLFLQEDKTFANLLTTAYRITQEEANETEEDTFLFGSKRSFHLSRNCRLLKSDFENIRIPKKIKERGKEFIKKLRSAACERVLVFFEDRQKFKYQLCALFDLEFSELEDVFKKNTAINSKEELTKSNLEEEIVRLKQEYETFYNSSEKNKIILGKWKQNFSFYSDKLEIIRNSTIFSDDEIKETIKYKFTRFNEPIKILIREWQRLTYNPNLSFKEDFLLNLGFNKCPECMAETSGVNSS